MSDLLSHTHLFSQKMIETCKSTFNIEIQSKGDVELLEQIPDRDGLYINLFLTGTHYGEYILYMENSVAERMLEASGMSGTEDTSVTAGQVFGELLNIVAGIITPKLKGAADELTITSPRFFVGKPYYPPVQAARVSLEVEGGAIDCIFYIDKMLLDITNSYRDSLKRLVNSYKKLKTAHESILDQQKLLLHAEKVTSIGTLSAGVAHNINTPLGVIQLSTSSMEGEVKKQELDKDKILGGIQTISGTVDRISNIIQSIRAYSESVSIRDMDSVVATEFVERALREFKDQFAPRLEKVNLVVRNQDAGDAQFRCGEYELRRAVLNLLENALDAVESLPPETSREIIVETRENEGSVEISIFNPGEMIDPEVLNEILDPFYTTKGPGHAGLGLTLAKGVLEGHGGTIDVFSEETGTKFLIRVPTKLESGGAVE